VACGSDDPSKTVQAGGAGGEGGDGPSVAGKQNVAGSLNNGGGSKNSAGGDGGVPSQGGMPGPGGSAVAGAALGGESTGGAAAGAGGSTAGAGGEGGQAPLDAGLPLGCPGVITEYTVVTGTSGDDAFSLTELSNRSLVHGLEGDDTFPQSGDGADCLVGGPGDDDFVDPNEQASYFVGGPGADTYHVTSHANLINLLDMESGDTIALSATQFTWLSGAIGEPIPAYSLKAVAGYSTGADSGTVEGSSIIYDPNTGELWEDPNGGVKDGSSLQIGTIHNHDSYVFDINDFIVE
jgi:hypothetical protein